jgi:hypothetical protein
MGPDERKSSRAIENVGVIGHFVFVHVLFWQLFMKGLFYNLIEHHPISVTRSSNPDYGFHLAGPWGLFLKAAKNCLILLNGSVALKFVIRQPQRKDSVATEVFSACSEFMFKATGAFDRLWKNLCCVL